MEEFSSTELGPWVVEEYDRLCSGQGDAEGESLQHTEAGMGSNSAFSYEPNAHILSPFCFGQLNIHAFSNRFLDTIPECPASRSVHDSTQLESQCWNVSPLGLLSNESHGDVMLQPPTTRSIPLTSTESFPLSHNDNAMNLEVNNCEPNTDFQFESKAKVIEDRRPPSKRKRMSSSTEGFRCEEPGCQYRGTFTRKYELQRHMKKHTKSKRIDCPVLGCPQKGNKALYREDKSRLHMESHTGDQDSVCPHTGCQFGPMSLSLLRLHILNHKNHDRLVQGILDPFNVHWGAMSQAFIKCPLPKCRDWASRQQFAKHLRDHNSTILREHSLLIQNVGFDALTGEVLCPVCLIGAERQHFSMLSDLQEHILLSHLLSDAQHFVEFRDQIKSLPYSWDTNHTFNAWRFYGSPRIQKCCFCDIEETIPGNTTHHLTLFKDPQDIYPFRRQILQMWPEFGLHPVFDDIMPTIDKLAIRRWR